nr:helix-turn-helix transcriptional regulator [Kibdelosporangium sp. MJ126-NF4]CTQ97366.1 regulatory protein, LuxR [Kibdelosporangium sp. MJ126-NF4]
MAERRVADLAATGHRNREISVKLHITVSTVEQHLTRVYRKLRIPNRAALRERLGAHYSAES